MPSAAPWNLAFVTPLNIISSKYAAKVATRNMRINYFLPLAALFTCHESEAPYLLRFVNALWLASFDLLPSHIFCFPLLYYLLMIHYSFVQGYVTCK